MWVAGIRPYHQITRNFAMQYELGYEYRMTKLQRSKRQRQRRPDQSHRCANADL